MGFIMFIMKKTRLSDITIDVDKDWQKKGITDIKQVAELMSKGDLVVRDTNILVRIQTGPESYVLTSTGYNKIPVWAPAGGALKYYFPVIISLVDAESIIAGPDVAINKGATLAREIKSTIGDAPLDYIKRFLSTISLVDAENVIVAPDVTRNQNAQIKSGLSILCDGFVEETALGVQTDHTAQARDAVANDLNLNPMSDTVLDKVYIGSNYKFWEAVVNQGTVGVGNWTNGWYYWNGAWVACVNELDGSNEWQQGTGLKLISHTPQGDWALHNIMGYNLYWLMCRTDNFVNRVTKPLGSQIWVCI